MQIRVLGVLLTNSQEEFLVLLFGYDKSEIGERRKNNTINTNSIFASGRALGRARAHLLLFWHFNVRRRPFYHGRSVDEVHSVKAIVSDGRFPLPYLRAASTSIFHLKGLRRNIKATADNILNSHIALRITMKFVHPILRPT